MTAARYGGEPPTNIPVGGAAGDVLTKVSDTDLDTQPYVSFSVATNSLTVGSYTVNQMEVTMELVEFG